MNGRHTIKRMSEKSRLPSLTVSDTHTHLVVLGGATTAAVNTSLGCPGAPMDLLYLPRFFGEGGCGRPSEKVALLLAGRTESLRGLMGGGGGWGSDTLGLRFLRLSSIRTRVRRRGSAARLGWWWEGGGVTWNHQGEEVLLEAEEDVTLERKRSNIHTGRIHRFQISSV